MKPTPTTAAVLALLAAVAARRGESLACAGPDGETTRTRIHTTDAAGEFVVEIEGQRVARATIDGQDVPEDRIRQEDGCASVADAHGATVLEIQIGPDGTLRWKTRKPRVTVGITMGDVDEALAAHLGIAREEAVLVTDVTDAGPAARAGLERFDVLLAVDGRSPATRESLLLAVAAKRPGDELLLEVRRGPERRSIAVPVESERRLDRATADVPILSNLPLIGRLYTRTTDDWLTAAYVDRRAPLVAETSSEAALKAIEDRLARIEALLQGRTPR